MANVYSIVFSVVGVIGMHTCLLVWVALLLPTPVERARRQIENSPGFSWLVGVACCLATVGLVSGFLVIRMQNVPRVNDALEFLSESLHFTRFYNDAWIITNTFAWLLAAPVLVALVIGGAAFAQLFALRAAAQAEKKRPLAGLVAGAFCTSAACFMPIVGWFVFLPVVSMIAVGAGARAVLQRRPVTVGEPLAVRGSLRESTVSHR